MPQGRPEIKVRSVDIAKLRKPNAVEADGEMSEIIQRPTGKIVADRTSKKHRQQVGASRIATTVNSLGHRRFPRRFFGRPNRRNFTSSSRRLKWTAKSWTARKPNSASAPSASTRQRLFAERQALRTLRHLQSSGHGRRRRGAAGCAAVFPRGEAEGIRLQRHPHLAQSAHAGTARSLRPARHVGHG